MKKSGIVVLIGITGIIVNWLSLLISWWWITPIVGLLIGLFINPTGRSLLLSLVVGGLSWGLPLALLATTAPVQRVANAVESIIGLSATDGVAIIVLTIISGCILSVVCTWVSIAGKKVLNL